MKQIYSALCGFFLLFLLLVGLISTFDKDAFEQGKIAGLQEAILAIMEKKGPVTEQMRRDVIRNTHHDSLVNWVKSFY